MRLQIFEIFLDIIDNDGLFDVPTKEGEIFNRIFSLPFSVLPIEAVGYALLLIDLI